MKIFPYNAELEAQIAEIKKIILLSMNGITSEKMTNSGIIYKKNYGVSLPRIKEIAARFIPNALLAERLWYLKERETMILATLLFPPAQFSKEKAEEWVKLLNTQELCEQLSFNLLQHIPSPFSLIETWITAENPHKQIISFLIASRISGQMANAQTNYILAKIIDYAESDSKSLCQSMCIALRFLCRKDRDFSQMVLEKIHTFEHSNNYCKRYIYQELKLEIDFRHER